MRIPACKFPLSLLLLASALPTACSRSHDEPNGSQPDQAQALVQVEAVESPVTAQALISQSVLRCEDPGQCPAAVGMFLAADRPGGFLPDSDSVAACTAVLVGKDLALTNSHCIPSAVKLAPSLCPERIRIVLPQAGGQEEETLSCAELLGFSERATPMSPDLALLRLERKTGRAPLPVDRSGVRDGSVLRSFKVNPKLRSRTGTLVSEPCRSVAGSYRMPIYRGEADPIVVLGDCTALPGNSGGALVSQEGKLAALMQAELPLSERARVDWSQNLEGESTFAPLALGTSLRCLSADPEKSWAWNPSCTTVFPESVAQARPRLSQFLGTEPLESEIGSLLVPFLSQSSFFRWERVALETGALRRQETIQPKCLLEGEGESDLDLLLPKLEIGLKLNRYLQMTGVRASLSGFDTVPYHLSFERGFLSRLDGAGEPLKLEFCQPDQEPGDPPR